MGVEKEDTKVAFRNRDLSWLGFNGRILEEAFRPDLPLLAKINFLAIYSSNLDEFFRVRMPVLAAIKRLRKKHDIHVAEVESGTVREANRLVEAQQSLFGKILIEQVIPGLKKKDVLLVYNDRIPESISAHTRAYFLTTLAAYLEITFTHEKEFFPENNQLYFLVVFEDENFCFVNIPSDQVSRFFSVEQRKGTYVVFIDDILRQNIQLLFPDLRVKGLYSFKVTRDAEIDLANEFEGDLARKIEQQINKRDFGLATRLLVQPNLPSKWFKVLLNLFHLKKTRGMNGGFYHNLSDFFRFPVHDKSWNYSPQPPLPSPISLQKSLFSVIQERDILVSTPYQSYDTVLRFFNEAAIDHEVNEVYCTMYRVAKDSRILHALMSAVKNGKKVTVFVELKARFDEENNIHWSRLLRAAGVKVLYSIPNLKVHAKVALVRKNQDYYGLFSTGNLNERTSDTYADHILLTAHKGMVSELEQLFLFLGRRRGKTQEFNIHFEHLLVAQFNLATGFVALIEREIEQARLGLPAGITIKLNNLEERGMIRKLYEAAEAGVQVNLIIRSICCLVPDDSPNLRVLRIVDRYLEHSRIFIFYNQGQEKVFMGSADWMNRNIFNRIEVCFPVYQPSLKREIMDIIQMQLQDTSTDQLRSQQETYAYFKRKHDNQEQDDEI